MAHGKRAPARAVDDQDSNSMGIGEDRAPQLRRPWGTSAPVPGTRASANTSGPDFAWRLEPGEIADLMIRTERRKLVSSAGPVSDKSEPSRKFDPAVSPDVSPTPSFVDRAS